MNTHRMDQETVERLLVGPVADALDGPEVLVRLLAAVRAAPHPHELSGEGAALQAFRLAQAGSAPAPRPARRFLAGLLAAKVAFAALVTATTGGVALAAVTGTLPGPLGHPPAAMPNTGTGSHPTPTERPKASVTPAASPTARPGGGVALNGLCNAYRTMPVEKQQKMLTTPRFAELVAVAGGPNEVPGYCDRLLQGRGTPNGSPARGSKRPEAGSSSRTPGRPDLVSPNKR